MRHGPLQWIASLLFTIQMYLSMVLIAIVLAPMAVLRKDGANRAIHFYTSYILWTARWMLGLKSEVRGTVPKGEVLIASKHQSFLDILILVHALPRPKFIMKSILKYAPFLGWYALKIGCVPVDRGKRAEAIRQMMDGVKSGTTEPGQLIIFPQGTRVAPGAYLPYKVGAAVLYGELGQTCVPVACNVGLFWARRRILRKPGVAVVEFLDPMKPGLTRDAFTRELETQIEARSNALMQEAGFAVNELPHHDRGA